MRALRHAVMTERQTKNRKRDRHLEGPYTWRIMKRIEFYPETVYANRSIAI